MTDTGSALKRVTLVLLLWIAGLGAAAQYGKVAIVYERLPELYPEAGAALGLAVSLVGLVGIALGIAAGVTVGRLGPRRALLGALAGGAVVSVLQGLAPPFWAFVALRIVEGVSHLVIVVAAPTLISQLAEGRMRGAALTLWGTFFGVAFALLALLGLPLVERAGVPALFLAHGGYMALSMVLLLPLLPHDGPVGRPLVPGAGDLVTQTLRIYRSPAIGAPAIGWLFYTFCFLSFLTLVPPFLPPEHRVAVVAAMPLVSIASSMTLGVVLLRVMSSVRVVQIGFFLSALCVLALAFSPGAPWLCIAVAAALGLVQGASFAAVPDLNADPGDRALANGGLAQMGNLGNTLGVPVLASVVLAVGHIGLSLPLALVLTIGGLAHLWLERQRLAG